MERCKHGMIATMCAMCTRSADHQVKIRRPHNTESTTSFGAAAVVQEAVEDVGFVTVKAEQDHHSHAHLDAQTKTVHILGHPFRWLIELILVKAPNVRTIQVIPSMLAKLRSQKDLCAVRGVQIIGGHIRPDMAWEKGEKRHTKSYYAQQTFLEKLEGDQKALFDELIVFEFEAVEFVLKYYGLRGCEVQSQMELMKEYGHCGNHITSMYINAVLYYLDQKFVTGARSVQIAEAMRHRVVRLRECFAHASHVSEINAVFDAVARRYGLDCAPAALKPVCLETFEGILKARSAGRLDRFRDNRPRLYDVVMLRFGLHESHPRNYRTLQQVGDLLGGITRERVRQLEEEALLELGLLAIENREEI